MTPVVEVDAVAVVKSALDLCRGAMLPGSRAQRTLAAPPEDADVLQGEPSFQSLPPDIRGLFVTTSDLKCTIRTHHKQRRSTRSSAVTDMLPDAAAL